MLNKIKSTWRTIKRYDPAEIIKRRYGLSGWKAELVDWIVGFGVAALLYFVILPMILNAYPPAVIVQSCSMKGTLNVGDIVVLHGASFDEIHAPLVVLNTTFDYSILPNNITQETKTLVFPDGQTLPVEKTGDIIVYNSKTSGIQIIHRVIAKVKAKDGNFYITKGDANKLPDSVRIECAEWEQIGNEKRCTKLSSTISRICNESDVGWPGCLATPVTDADIIGKEIFWIPFLGHIKLIVFHILTLGTMGYPGPMWC
ncbi:MAG: hypothetical protein J7K68_02875 [Candidatus Diapherotrites archaeon]|nr:hypothetical protein [Candidatus Diapherotrites archaeon]